MRDRRIETVYVSSDRLYIGLTDRRTFFSVSFSVAPELAAATRDARLRYRLDHDGRTIVWDGELTGRLDLNTMLTHFSVQMDHLPNP